MSTTKERAGALRVLIARPFIDMDHVAPEFLAKVCLSWLAQKRFFFCFFFLTLKERQRRVIRGTRFLKYPRTQTVFFH